MSVIEYFTKIHKWHTHAKNTDINEHEKNVPPTVITYYYCCVYVFTYGKYFPNFLSTTTGILHSEILCRECQQVYFTYTFFIAARIVDLFVCVRTCLLKWVFQDGSTIIHNCAALRKRKRNRFIRCETVIETDDEA